VPTEFKSEHASNKLDGKLVYFVKSTVNNDTAMIVSFDGRYLDKAGVRIAPDDRGFLFGDGVYEVVRSHRGRLFRWQDHQQRFLHGLRELRIGGVDVGSLESAARQLLRQNGLEREEATVYLQATRGAGPRTHRFPPPGTLPTVYIEAKPFTPPIEARQKGAAAIIVPDQRWGRCDIKSINLLANVLANQQAFEAGAVEAIFSRDGFLLEGSHSSILFVKDNVLVYPPLTNFILPGVTREVVLSLAAGESIAIECRACRESEIFDFQEVLMVGTGSEIIPLTKVNDREIGDGKPGPVALRLQRAFQELIGTSQEHSELSPTEQGRGPAVKP